MSRRIWIVAALGLVSAGCTSSGNVQTPFFQVGGTVSGLLGRGLILEDQGDDLNINENGAFHFPGTTKGGTAYAVSVKAQPVSPSQVCTVSGGSGTISGRDVTSVVVTCVASTFTIGGVVSGLTGSGLVLVDNGGDNLTVTGNGTFAFPTALTSGASYSVGVLSPPQSPAQTCVVQNGNGTVVASDIDSVSVTCTTASFTVGGTITGLTGFGLQLQDNGGDNLLVPPGATTFTFMTPVASGASYSASVLSQPQSPSQTCTLSGPASATMGDAAVTSLTIAARATASPWAEP